MKRIGFVPAPGLAVSTFAQAGPAQTADPAITQQDCNDARDEAQTSESCTATTLTAINPSDTPDGNLYQCDVTVDCAAVGQEPVRPQRISGA